MSQGVKLTLTQAKEIAGDIVGLLRPHVEWIAVAGAVRRGAAETSDIDIVLIPRKSYKSFTESLLERPGFEKAKLGERGVTRWGDKLRVLSYRGVPVELAVCDELNRGYILWLKTGPQSKANQANRYLMTRLAKAPFALKSGYVWYGTNKVRTGDEETFFALCGLTYIPPGNRSVTAYREAFDSHAGFPDPGEYVDKQQATLFDLDKHAAYADPPNLPAGDIKNDQPASPHFEWERPWLDDTGYVWVYVGYGEWVLKPVDSADAKTRLSALNLMSPAARENEAHRLRHWLDVNGRVAVSFTRMVDLLTA